MRARFRSARFSIAPILLVVIALALGAVAISAALARAQEEQPSSSPAIQSEADLVVLPVSVTDHDGHFVSDLTKDNFRVFDDGKPQDVSVFIHGDVEVTVGLLIDCSGSMRFNRDEVSEAAKDFLESSNPADQIFVVNFNQDIEFGLPRGVPFTSNVAQLEAAVQRGPSEGRTALYDAIAVGARHLAAGRGNKKALILITDGGDNSSAATFKETLASVQGGSVVVYAIGIIDELQADVNTGVLRKLANASGGEAYFPRAAEQVPSITQQIAHDLREQYTLAYLPNDAKGKGGYRTLRVSVKAPGKKGLKVRTRAGYMARATTN
jgi:Ca-activated chloride channel family protein